MLGQHVHGDGVGGDGGGIDPGSALLDSVVVDKVARLEVVGRVEEDVGSGEKRVDVRGCEVGDLSADIDLTVEERDFESRGFGFRQGVTRVGLVKQNLALEIAFFDEVAIDEGEGPDASAREQAGRRRAGGSAADEGYMGGAELFLAGLTYWRKKHLT